MEYLALYRKYRPSSLEEMVGQSEIKTILASSIENNTISHAYLFSGPRGTGKTSTAKIFSRMVNCEDLHDGIPCGKCPSCLAIANNNDVVEIDAASNNGVDEIRDLREKANLVPSVCKYKVYIIDEVHMLTTQAFNALLKTLEEPPKHVIFILATTEYHKVPLTITSRCQKYQFNKLSISDNVKRLKEISNLENIEITDEALNEIAKISDGAMRDSINFLDQLRSFKNGNITIEDVYEVCGNVSYLEIADLLLNIKNNDAGKITSFLEEISNKGKSYNSFLEDILSFLKDVVLYKNNVSLDNIKSDSECVINVSKEYLINEIFDVIKMIDSLMDKLKYSSRQSVVVVTNFLILMNELSDKKVDVILDNKSIGLNFKDNINKKDDKNILVVDKEIKKDVVYKDVIEDNIYKESIEIIVNNAFALADKKLKLEYTKAWGDTSNYLLDKKYANVASRLNDSNIEVASSSYLVFSSNYDSTIDFVYDNYNICTEYVNEVLNGDFNIAFISNNMWNNYKNKFIEDYKNGIKYNVKELNQDIKNINVKKEENNSKTAVDMLIDIVGNDIIEYK